MEDQAHIWKTYEDKDVFPKTAHFASRGRAVRPLQDKEWRDLYLPNCPPHYLHERNGEMMYKIVIDGWSREMHIPEADADRGWIEVSLRPPLSFLVTGKEDAKVDIITLRLHRTRRETFEYVNRSQDPFKNSEIFLLFSRMLAAAGNETKKEEK